MEVVSRVEEAKGRVTRATLEVSVSYETFFARFPLPKYLGHVVSTIHVPVCQWRRKKMANKVLASALLFSLLLFSSSHHLFNYSPLLVSTPPSRLETPATTTTSSPHFTHRTHKRPAMNLRQVRIFTQSVTLSALSQKKIVYVCFVPGLTLLMVVYMKRIT